MLSEVIGYKMACKFGFAHSQAICISQRNALLAIAKKWLECLVPIQSEVICHLLEIPFAGMGTEW